MTYFAETTVREVGNEKRVLLIAFHFPPSQQIGSVRPAGLAKYLPEFGWHCIVVTPYIEARASLGVQVIETGYQDVIAEWKRKLRLRVDLGLQEQLNLPVAVVPKSQPLHTRLISLMKDVLVYPDPMSGWLPFATAAIADFAAKHTVNAIISTGPPMTCHLLGAAAQKALNCPWVADFRDLWNTNPMTLADATGVVASFKRRTERKTLSSASAIVTVSEPWADRLRLRHSGHKVVAITNGFDPEDMCASPSGLTKKFTITHTGRLYQGRRDPTILFEAIRELIASGKLVASKIALRFYGPVDPFLAVLVRKYGLGEITEIHTPVSRQDSMRLQRESQVLLLLTWWSPEEVGIHTGKVFEYLGSKRPILAVGGGPGVVTDLLKETGAGVHAFEKDDVAGYLIHAYQEFEKLGYVPYHGIESMSLRYSHREMARKFSALLEDISGLPDRPASYHHRAAQRL